MISVKFGSCMDCEKKNNFKEVPLIAGRCQFHYKVHRAIVNNEKNAKKKKPIKKPSHLEQVTKLWDWYEEKMKTSDAVCENCGAPINKDNTKEWHGSQAHILPKSENSGFPSVADHPMNHMVLGYYCCHGQYDSSWLNASKMPVFAVAKERFELFKDAIWENERRRIPEVFHSVPCGTMTIKS